MPLPDRNGEKKRACGAPSLQGGRAELKRGRRNEKTMIPPGAFPGGILFRACHGRGLRCIIIC